MKFKVEIKGLKELQAKLHNLPKELQKEAEAVVEDGAKLWVRNAKNEVVKDYGTLAQGISYEQLEKTKGKIRFEIISSAFYSPYVEWGTITKVKVPPGERDYAIQFKGKGLTDNGGVIPRPFFFKQAPLVQQNVEKRLRALLDSINL